jgi:hypothetical protein
MSSNGKNLFDTDWSCSNGKNLFDQVSIDANILKIGNGTDWSFYWVNEGTSSSSSSSSNNYENTVFFGPDFISKDEFKV